MSDLARNETVREVDVKVPPRCGYVLDAPAPRGAGDVVIARLAVGSALVVGLSLAPDVTPHTTTDGATRIVAPAAAPAIAPPIGDELVMRTPVAVVARTNQVRSIAACGGDVWIATRGGLDQYTPGAWNAHHYATEQGTRHT